MAVDKLVDSTQLDSDLTSVANAIRAKSGGSSQLAFPAGFVSEIGNIPSGGGGLTPPVNAVAQFEVRITISNQPASFSIDFTKVIEKLTANRAYKWDLLLWRDDVVSSVALSNLASEIIAFGRIATTSCDLNYMYACYSNSSSMTSGVQGNTSSIVNAKSFASNIETITLKNITNTDLTGKWKGVFTVLAPWTDEYTGTKLTSCPTGFLTYAAAT